MTTDELLRAVARRLAAAEHLAPPDGDAALAAIARTSAMVLDAAAASIAVHDPATDRLVFMAAAGPAAGEVVGMSIDSSAGIAGYAFTTGQPLAVADATADPRFDRRVAEATGYLPNSLLATPLTDAAGTVGVLEALDRQGGGTFTLRDLDLAASLAQAATAAIRADAASRDATRLLRDALVALVRAEDDGDAMDPDRVDELVARVTQDLATTDDPTWRLADRIARLGSVDPDAIELAIDWLDALLRRGGRDARAPGTGDDR